MNPESPLPGKKPGVGSNVTGEPPKGFHSEEDQGKGDLGRLQEEEAMGGEGMTGNQAAKSAPDRKEFDQGMERNRRFGAEQGQSSYGAREEGGSLKKVARNDEEEAEQGRRGSTSQANADERWESGVTPSAQAEGKPKGGPGSTEPQGKNEFRGGGYEGGSEGIDGRPGQGRESGYGGHRGRYSQGVENQGFQGQEPEGEGWDESSQRADAGSKGNQNRGTDGSTARDLSGAAKPSEGTTGSGWNESQAQPSRHMDDGPSPKQGQAEKKAGSETSPKDRPDRGAR